MTSPANPALAACKAFLANLQSVHYCQGNMDLQLYGNVWNIQNWTLSHYIIKNGVYPITWKLVFIPLYKKTDTCSRLSEQRQTISSLYENSVKVRVTYFEIAVYVSSSKRVCIVEKVFLMWNQLLLYLNSLHIFASPLNSPTPDLQLRSQGLNRTSDGWS